jgi:NADH-quinone oxidoreductase subunit L
MFHLTTHAFFTALLFLAAGSVILALHHEQDIWKMGGLRRKTPVTFAVFVIGTLALAGVFPLSGFYSKDEILLLALHQNRALFSAAVITAGLTAFYMGRELFVVFFGHPRDGHAFDHAHESPLVITLPLIFLAILSIAGGWYGAVPHFLEPHGAGGHHDAWLGYALLAVPAAGFALSAAVYLKPAPSDAPLRKILGPAHGLVQNKFYFDEFYALIVKYVQGGAANLCEFFDLVILQRLGIGGLSFSTGLLGRTVRLVQTGDIRAYAFFFGLGAAALVYWLMV